MTPIAKKAERNRDVNISSLRKILCYRQHAKPDGGGHRERVLVITAILVISKQNRINRLALIDFFY